MVITTGSEWVETIEMSDSEEVEDQEAKDPMIKLEGEEEEE